MTPAVIVVAKAPVAGRSKTRLCPPLSPPDAARIAEACLVDTLEAVSQVATRRILALDGAPGAWLVPGFEVAPQRGDGLGARIASAFEDCGGEAVLIGMDTPQVTASLLRAALDALSRDDAVLGPAADGGWWLIGLRRPDRRVFEGIPTSTPWTGTVQHQRLHELRLTHSVLPILRDVDEISDAREVAALIRGSRLDRELELLDRGAARDRKGPAWLAGRR